MKKFTLFMLFAFCMLGTAVAQDEFTYSLLTPADGASVERVDNIFFKFPKDVNVVLPEGGIDVVNNETNEVFKLVSMNVWVPKNYVVLNFEEVMNEDGDMVSQVITGTGTYSYTIPAGCITSVDGEPFAEQTFTFTIAPPVLPAEFVLNYSEAEKVKELGDLEITFKNVNEVKLVDGADSPIVYIPGDSEIEGEVTLSDNKITVSFGELTEEGVYTYYIPAGMFTMDGVENEERVVSVELYSFDITPLEIVSITPVAGNVDKLERIIIEFNQIVSLHYDYDVWQYLSNNIILKGEDEEYTLTYNPSSNLSNKLEYVVNANWNGFEYASSAPIIDEGTYTLNLADIIVDHAPESYIDEWGYNNTRWHSVKQNCEGTVVWNVVAAEVVKGDINNDGVVSVTDIQAIVNLILSAASTEEEPAADINRDGAISVTDIQSVVNIILNIE